MKRCGTPWKTFDQFKSYLTNRTQRCSDNGCLSGNDPWPPFISNLYQRFTCLSIVQRTQNDTHIIYAGSDLHLIRSSLSHDLDKLGKWLVSSRLTLNPSKPEFMLICSRKRFGTLSDTLELSIDNVPIEPVSFVKSVGICIDENLTWHSHIDKLCKRIASAIRVTMRVNPFVPQPH